MNIPLQRCPLVKKMTFVEVDKLNSGVSLCHVRSFSRKALYDILELLQPCSQSNGFDALAEVLLDCSKHVWKK
jgi:hypothetical protein